MTDECKAYLLRRYLGEVYGEALFETLAASESDGSRRGKWEVLARLERQTKERIQQFLDRACIPVPELPESARKGKDDARHLARVGWPDLMRGFRRELERFVAEFREAENLDRSGGELYDLLRRITAHEEALLQFVLRELAGGEDDSLDAVRELLGESHARG
jgi:hypothetical protein